MKEVKAIIQSHMISKVVRALHEVPHFPGLTLFDARGQGRRRGAGGAFKVTEDSIAETTQRADHIEDPGDGRILVTELPEVIRIRTGEKQQQAM